MISEKEVMKIVVCELCLGETKYDLHTLSTVCHTKECENYQKRMYQKNYTINGKMAYGTLSISGE